MSTAHTRLAALERQAERVQRRLDAFGVRINQYRLTTLAIFVGGILVASSFLALARWLGLLVIVGGCISFFFVSRANRKTTQSFLRHQAWLRMINTQIARLRMDWTAIPAVAPREEQEEHPFDLDLDISGERSLHMLVNTSVSFEGMQRLRDWLLCRMPDVDIIRARQALVRELIPLTRFRNKFMLNSLFATRVSGESVDGERLLAWLESRSELKQPRSTLIISIVIAVLFYASIILYVFEHISPVFCISLLLLSLVWFLLKKKEQGNLAEDTDYQRIAFGQLATIFEYLEKYPYAKNSQLSKLCEPFFLHNDRRPSLLLRKMERITARASWSRSVEVWLGLNVLVPIGAYTAYQLDEVKALVIMYLPLWLNAWYELEALCSLANFGYLNPEYVFPTIVSGKQPEERAVFEAKSLGHPLIASETKVVNDFRLAGSNDIILITGSNMAGKSTFLRTMGINLCLAYAGSVVNASSLRTSPFELYACIRVTDSLADGYSYFYAEVKRLKGLLTEIERGTQFPLFFLVDEIFKGTNTYERLVGSEAYIRSLIGRDCVGAISTHDLELVKLAEEFSGIKNYHFREEVRDGRMVFDYVLHRGPCPTRNALKIMELEGLPVTWDTAPHAV